MKNKKSLIPLLIVLLTGCSSPRVEPTTTPSKTPAPTPSGGEITPSPTPTQGGTSPVIDDVHPIQNMNILHAWNWKINDVKSHLYSIKEAGYGAIQLSPLQVKVDKSNYSNQSTSSQWWKLYQPLAFKISEGEESFLGTKDDLKSLCKEADKYGLKIVMDIVSNHLAGTNNNYNDQVYTKYPLHTYGQKTNDNSIQAVVQGHIGLPDLDTSKNQVQQDVLSLLKDYIDSGIDGFRFDAAKHIETPDDGEYASNYWPTILDGASNYAKSKNMDIPYYYGEILNTCGKGRSFSSYTKYMSIVDNKQATDTVNAIYNKSISSIKSTYNTKEDPSKLVLWAESHDTYANDSGYESTRSYNTETINKAYIIQASRKDAATLYLARPTNMNVTICSIDDNSGWKNQEIKMVNKFHSYFLKENENINNNNGCFVNVRGNKGAVIVDVVGTGSASIDVIGLSNGAYIDLISSREVEVKNEKATITFSKGASILVDKNSPLIEEDDDYGQLAYTQHLWLLCLDEGGATTLKG